MRKYNQIISCDRTPYGGWSVTVQSPHDQFHTQRYIGYTKKQALRMARITDFDKEAGFLFCQPPKRRGGHER